MPGSGSGARLWGTASTCAKLEHERAGAMPEAKATGIQTALLQSLPQGYARENGQGMGWGRGALITRAEGRDTRSSSEVGQPPQSPRTTWPLPNLLTSPDLLSFMMK